MKGNPMDRLKNGVTRFTGFARGAPVAIAIAMVAVPVPLSATWSVIAVDARTGRVVIASATCVPQGRFAGFPAKGLMDIQAIIVPGVGVAAAQAGVDGTRENQRLIYRELKDGTHPDDIIELLKQDESIERRQFGIVDVLGNCTGFSGIRNGAASLSVQDTVPARRSTSRSRATSWRRTTLCTWLLMPSRPRAAR